MDVKKKITGFLFIVLLCVFVFPVALSADEGYALYVGGVQVTNDNASDILGDGTASYDPASATLTLNNANLTEGALLPDPTAIECYGDLNIVLNGENTIDVRGKNVMGIY